MIIPEWESNYWQTVLDEAQERGDEEAIELAMKHLYPVYPNIEDVTLLEIEDSEILDIPIK